MYPGHFLAWICSGIMVAAVARKMDPGMMAFTAVGFAGAVAVVIAGWTTANPTMYRAGLALQVATPNWKRWRVTLIAGLVTTIVACFPVVFMRLLDFVGRTIEQADTQRAPGKIAVLSMPGGYTAVKSRGQPVSPAEAAQLHRVGFRGC